MKSRILAMLMMALPFMCAPNAGAQDHPDLSVAEHRLSACVGNHSSIYHPPYSQTFDAIMDSCKIYLEAYTQACIARGHVELKCRMAAVSFASSFLKQDPIDRQFSECLMREARSPSRPDAIVLLSLCRREREAFEASCRQRKNAKKCEVDEENMAEGAIGLR